MIDKFVDDLYCGNEFKNEITNDIRSFREILGSLLKNKDIEKYEIKKQVKQLADLYNQYTIIDNYINYLERRVFEYMRINHEYENDEFKVSYFK